MHTLDRLMPKPRLVERDSVDVAAEPERVWHIARHLELSRFPLVRALFAVRTLPGRARGTASDRRALRVDDLRSTRQRPGFQILADDPPREFAVGAIGKVWRLDIPFVHVDGAEAFARFHDPDEVKVAWAIRVEPRGEHDARLGFELRVDATDDAAWRKFRRYFRVIGPASRFIRRSVVQALARDLGTPESLETQRRLAGDDLLPDAAGQITHGITIEAPPEAVWPWLVQMGCQRAGFYSYDLLDNGNVPSAREVHPELQDVQVGDVLPATPRSSDGFEVLRMDSPRTLVLGALFDEASGEQLPFAADRPERYWHMTWAFVLEPLDGRTTRLHVRARAAIPSSGRLHLGWIRPVHSLMERAQLRHLKARVEGRMPRADVRDVIAGIGGAGAIAVTLATPFLREARSTWGLDPATAARTFPGDELVPDPRWGWTHGVDIDAGADELWPWVAQIGADRAGFYSYQWLENLLGCDVRNAETIHPEWAAREGGELVLHPKGPRLRIVSVEPGSFLLAYAAPDEAARTACEPWVAATWLLLIEPLGPERSRFISRLRIAFAEERSTRLQRLRFGPALAEPIGFVMDWRMLMGVRERVDRANLTRRAGQARAARPRARRREPARAAT